MNALVGLSPSNHRIKYDLPAPLSPMSAMKVSSDSWWLSPGRPSAFMFMVTLSSGSMWSVACF